ncbi:putative acetyltransferase [Alteromonadaceae bacterium 2753L.S.0a.02]|nr:putative acetyltransferase [Alteromonadaceae bacterium 2753L.S.0a.02]
MKVSLQIIEPHSRPILENLFQYYMYDLEEFVMRGLEPDGRYSYDFSLHDVYWQSEQHTPYFILQHGNLVGFALVRMQQGYEPTLCYDMEQYFVLRSYRKLGVGKSAFHQIATLHPGTWQIRVLPNSRGALSFWLAAVREVVDGECRLSQEDDHNHLMNFIRFTTKPAQR